MFGKLMRIPDGAMPTYYELLLDDVTDDSSRPAVERKRALARGLTARFHGSEAATAAEAQFDRLHVAREAPEEIEGLRFEGAGPTIHLPALLSEAFGISSSEARRMLAQGGVKLDGAALGAGSLDLAPEDVDGAVLQLGKRRFRRVELA
jgi:tyrosyl-tRNA synthetase